MCGATAVQNESVNSTATTTIPLRRQSATSTVGNSPLPPLLLNVQQVGALIGGVSERKIRAMVSTGEIPAPVHVGRLARWRRVDIERWVAALN
jgi:excisionase family DNA binding protein